MTGLVQCHLSILNAEIKKLSSTDSEIVTKVANLITEDGPFCLPFLGLETQHKQEKFYHTHFNFIVSKLLNIIMC